MRIDSVELSGGVLVGHTDMQDEVLGFLSGSYVWLFPKNNAFLYPHDALETHLSEYFKRIDTVKVSLKNLRTLSVVITERKPEALWCGTEGSEHCYFMDNHSTIFAESPSFSGDAYFKYYGDLAVEGVNGPLGGQYIASSTQFAELHLFVENIRTLGLRPEYLAASNTGTTTPVEQFTLMVSNGGKIYFDRREPLEQLFENLKALLRTPALADAWGRVEYIDLRYGNKVYYKLKIIH